MAKYNFSVIIPTYTGLETISGCFDSILNQTTKSIFEVVVIIDGPSEELAKLVHKYERLFTEHGINIRCKQFKQNKGRYLARLEGAQMARSNNLLYLDDRITFEPDYFDGLFKLDKDVLIPNVYEGRSNNFVSRCLYLLRKTVYGSKKFGSDFTSYVINHANFESSPKGTTSLWIRKKIFINACRSINDEAELNKYINEDTRLFKIIIDNGFEIYKSGEQKIFYQPRAKTFEEIKHLYQRGPRFVNYYIKPGTRFFLLLWVLALAGPLILCGIIYAPQVTAILLVLSLVTLILWGIYISENRGDIFAATFGVPLITCAFTLGIYKGLGMRLIQAIKNEA